MIKKILVANRGETALRIIRACKELGIKTVAVHSTADENSMHVRLADESVCIGPGPSAGSYLNMQAIISAASLTHADAIHPGIGFLSENPVFAQMVIDHGFIFIGPSPIHIAQMGDKVIAKQTAASLGLPIISGSEGEIADVNAALSIAENLGYPVLIKAASGGGGKGMKVVVEPNFLEESLKMAQMEAKANFGNEAVYMEKYLQGPRHIEVQILADTQGNVVHLGERDCSIQRSHQKVWEETPSPGLTIKEREQVGKVAAKAIKKMGYVGVGTVEFLYENGNFFFMEMNTRLQVEHTITEEVTGLDLVKEQIKVASGMPLEFSQSDVIFTGHAIECRINAENSETFLPSPGTVTKYHVPGGLGVRVDSHLFEGYKIPPYYDSLAAKLVVHGKTREEAICKVKRALDEYVILGIDTLIPLHKKLVDNPFIVSGNYDIKTLERLLEEGL